VTALLAGSPDIPADATLFSSALTTNKVHITSYSTAIKKPLREDKTAGRGVQHSPTPESGIHTSMPPFPHTSLGHMLN
jgi:hypothetical protein